ncbi:hypothetical protein Ctob_008232 [Chrysochromulina tobinii]|uniref:Uncharacterized protein n=1 Tax=Chrysochromulina tobinii TaxID=1460289 RepID=A0A0M0JWL0_9EUKA|nr:hypothetical protein Ctob_008232 [Chrysochromulina tobinii]|eukprot:KOO30518.1 hypothetical protein Ctob_008232 [Chrysochromulina sp. CCMP291]
MTTDADAEIAKFMARMAEKKAWSRIEEIKQEESVAGAAKAEAARRAAAAQERAAAFQGLLGGVPVEDEAPKADEAAILEAARLREVLAQANALAERALANRAAKVAAEAAAKATKEWDGGGLFGGALPSSVSPQQLEAVAEAEAEAEAEEAFAPWGELGAVAGAVEQLRATGGVALQDANAELQLIKPRYRAAAASWNAKEKGNDDERRVALKTALGGAAKPLTRPEALNTALDAKPKPTGDGGAALGGAVMGGANPRPSGAVLGGSSAAQLSARRLERHGVRMELRKVSARHGALSP